MDHYSPGYDILRLFGMGLDKGEDPMYLYNGNVPEGGFHFQSGRN